MLRLLSRVLLLLAAGLIAVPVGALADQSSQPSSPAAGQITAGTAHSCAVAATGLRCWGFGGNGRLGYASPTTIGDDETPAAQAPIDFGSGRSTTALSAGEGHTCAQLDDGTLRCWGFGGNGRLGYASTNDIGDDESLATIPAIGLGDGRTAISISAGDSHTCAVLDDGTVRCWGYALNGQLGYGDGAIVNGSPEVPQVGDDETPGSVAPVDLGTGATATTITAGGSHSCALLTGGSVRCWGASISGRLGTGNPTQQNIGDNESPTAVGPVDLGGGKATAISAGRDHTCAILDDATVRCWGAGANGQLGYGNTANVGATNTPGSAGPVDLGSGARATAIGAGREHTCAILDNGSVRCWGGSSFGELGYANQTTIGDDETPGSVGPVDLGSGRTATALATGDHHTCASLDDGSVRCWGFGANGRLGYCNELTIGDTETPAAAGPVDLGAGGAACRVPLTPVPGGDPVPPPPPPASAPAAPAATPAAPAAPVADPQALENARARALRSCRRAAARRPKALRTRARRLCLRRHGRTPGRVTGLRARALSRTRIALTFSAPGSAGAKAPPARAYLVRQSSGPRRRDFARAPALCRGSCRFVPSGVGARITLTVTGLRPGTTYYYAVAARDNVTGRLGRRSLTIRVRTRQSLRR